MLDFQPIEFLTFVTFSAACVSEGTGALGASTYDQCVSWLTLAVNMYSTVNMHPKCLWLLSSKVG